MKRLRASLLVLGVALSGCASSTGSSNPGPFDTSSARPADVQLIVQNRNFADARLYTIQRGKRTQLGTVGGKRDAEFTLPWTMSDPLRIEINLLAGPTCTTREMLVDPGDILDLQIAAVFSQSSFCR